MECSLFGVGKISWQVSQVPLTELKVRLKLIWRWEEEMRCWRKKNICRPQTWRNKTSLLKIYQKKKQNLTLAWGEAASQFTTRNSSEVVAGKKKKGQLQPKEKGFSLLQHNFTFQVPPRSFTSDGSSFLTAPICWYFVCKTVASACKGCFQPCSWTRQGMCRDRLTARFLCSSDVRRWSGTYASREHEVSLQRSTEAKLQI